MKVHTFQIEVMWLVLAAMFCRTTNKEEIVNTYSSKHEKSKITEYFNPKKIRPPPSGYG